MFEQGVFPSTFNSDHKWTFTIVKRSSWSPRSINLFDLLSVVADRVQVVKLELLDATYQYYETPRFDQTLTPVGECAVEIVLRRWTAYEVARRGRLPPPATA